MKQSKKSWRGTMTALATPMHADGSIDWPLLDRLVDAQLAAGIATLVVNGSTAEAVAMSPAERHALLAHVIGRAGGRAAIVAGTGSSATATTVQEQQKAHALGADAALVVTPPYNRPNLRGLLLHYQAVASAVALPILLYNVPSRAGLGLSVEAIAALAQVPGIVGLKDADSDIGRVHALRAQLGPTFALLSGDDATAGAYVAAGGDGVVSVASNCVPAAMNELIVAASRGDRDAWLAAQARLQPLFAALGSDSNPIPVKAALAHQHGSQAHYRLPLCPMVEAARAALVACLEAI